ncbi:hypothetical protein [Rhodosalinus sp. 5P4]|uniref:hypothetical protein n=1 Tax=Rhodosalinus sp. 5P4 TaxID=3239196 RepID=UPI0035246664
MTPIRSKPELTFPPAVAERVRREYAKAHVILEYGSGGSTVLAAGLPGTRTFSVESDENWAEGLRSYIAAQHPDAAVTVHHADIGPTREWGHPERYRKRHVLRYLDYSRSVWKREDFLHPDLILIDGRFRIGCFLTCLANLRRPTRILFDDYENRPRYHVVERYCRPVETVERLAVFEARPENAPRSFDFGRIRAELHRIWPRMRHFERSNTGPCGG